MKIKNKIKESNLGFWRGLEIERQKARTFSPSLSLSPSLPTLLLPLSASSLCDYLNRKSPLIMIMKKMKRKDLELDEVSDDFSDFSLSSPARKIRRLVRFLFLPFAKRFFFFPFLCLPY
jgi:hypothetical protein